ncbi:hypothetical protein [Prauserella muralis]|uniref:Uncharacterized protein n=1 Tax=Prauserella muralis TaxID=588067 RepID=A0A2V4BB81_9PSEU|nr:hypothetical protein [Prauserella muralis]PXY32587.1 hypothetical protein BAY60_10135 [Prauserella muralis]TWE23696.1 hypothetical protein FHX69_4990 [Prauserella muralis]
MLEQARSGTALTFRETMTGPFAMGAADPEDGARLGRDTGSTMTLRATVTVADTAALHTEPRPPARLDGTLALPGAGEPVAFEDGLFHLFPASGPSPHTLMVYELGFTHDGMRYHLTGHKAAGERPFVGRLWPDTTTLRVRLHRGEDAAGEVAGAGVLRLGAADLARLVASLRTPGADSLGDAVRARGGYAWLFARNLTGTYLPWPS